jgi:hypothetical protein
MNHLHRLLAATVVGACLVMTGTAQASPVEGCDPKVMDAMQATAQARVAADKSVDDEIYTQDDSVLALTCFDQSAKVSADMGGQIFSGDFTKDITPVVNDALGAMYGNFNDSIAANSTSATLKGIYSKTDMATSLDNNPDKKFKCTAAQELWDYVDNQGIAKGAPYVTFDDLQNGATAAPAGAGTGNSADPAAPRGYLASWNSTNSKDAFTNMNTRVEDLNTARELKPIPNFTDTATIDSPCAVLKAANPDVNCAATPPATP